MMNGRSLIGTLVFTVVVILVLSLAISLLPYILLVGMIWYFYRSLIRPMFSGRTSEKREDSGVYTPKSDSGIDETMDHQVKSVRDESFFQQKHDVVDVDYDEDSTQDKK